MNIKVLITADIHIFNYKNHNRFDDPNFRLGQFKKLAERLVNIATSTKAKALIIAGDFLHVASPRPIVVNAAFEFLDILTRDLDVYLIHGNHDLDTRGQSQINDTLLAICNRVPRVTYLYDHHKVIGNTAFYFLGWTPNLQEKVDELTKMGGTDVFIGHFQPGTVKAGQRGMLLEGGEYVPDNPPWKIGFVGDIHTHQTCKANIIVPGVPIQHSFNDGVETGVILLDTDTLAWKHLKTNVEPYWKFLRFLVTDDDYSHDPLVVTSAKTRQKITQVPRQIANTFNVLQLINQEISKHHLEKIHTAMYKSIPSAAREENNLNFYIESIKIKGFRSIEDFEWQNVPNGVTLLAGQNGSGKSSLINAIIFALTGQGSARTLLQRTKKNMYVEVTLVYEHVTHTIRRGWSSSGKLHYLVNGVEQYAENQKALASQIEENLPFLKFVDLFYHYQDRPGFLASYNYNARVDLISRVLGLRLVQDLSQVTTGALSQLEQKLTKIRTQITAVTAIVDQERLIDFSAMEMVDDDLEQDMRVLKENTKLLLDKERRKVTTEAAKRAGLRGEIARATSDVSTLEARRKTLATRVCFTCGQGLETERLENLSKSLERDLEQRIRELRELGTEEASLSAEVSETTLLERLDTQYERMTARLAEVIYNREQQENFERIQSRIVEGKKKLISLQEEENILLDERAEFRAYAELLHTNGSVMVSLLERISQELSDEMIRVRAYKQLASGETRPDFGVDIRVAGHWIPYDEASGGQRTVADLTILTKIVTMLGGIGLLVFDETFRFLDMENLELVVDLIKTMQCNNIFITSHAQGFSYWDTSIVASLDKDGNTLYSFR